MQWDQWRFYRTYAKRCFSFNYKGHEIDLSIKASASVHQDLVKVSWRSGKLKTSQFEFVLAIDYADFRKRENMRELFKHLKRSLAHGLNPSSRPVIDRLIGADKMGRHPIHIIYKSSSSLT